MMKTRNAVLVIVCFSWNVHTYDAANYEQQHAVEIVKGWKAKQKSYVNVLVTLKQQQADFYSSKIKQRLVNTQEALENVSDKLDVFEVNQTMFDRMLQSKQKELTRALSQELELGNVITLTDNSEKIMGENCFTMINNFTEATYGEELLFRQNSFNFFLSHQLSFNSRPGTFPKYENATNVRRVRNRIVAGSKHILVLMPNGKLYSTGVYNNGNLGRLNTNTPLFYNNTVSGLDGLEILQIEAHRHSSMVLTTKGLYMFGLNDRSQLATGGTKPMLTPTFVNGFNFGTRLSQIAMGYYASYAIDETGKLWAWGANDQGQIGDRTWDEKNRPFSVYRYGALANQTVVKVCAGNGSALALTSSGNLVAFGDNTYGQLGTANYVSTGEPVLVNMSPFRNETITDIQCGMFHNLVLTASGKVFAFGRNNYGQVGDGTINTLAPTPKIVDGLNCTVTMIHTKGHVSFAVCESQPGFFYSWGLNDIGQAGAGIALGNVLSPKLVKYSAHPIVEITSNEDYSFLFLADGSVHAVGACFNVPLFFEQECLDLYPRYYTGTNYPKRYAFSVNGLFTQVRLQNKMQLLWNQKKPVYFEMGDVAYLLKSENNLPSRRNNGFNMYTTNVTTNDMVWKMIEYNETTNTGFPHSIHNTHILKHGEYLYLFGGVVNDDISNRIYRAPIYDLVQSWELINDTLPVPLASGMIVSIGEYAYIFGGIISIYEFNSTVDQGPTVRHNVTNGIMRAPHSNITNWEIISNVIPSPLHSAYLEVVGDYVYLFGGSSTVYGSGINIFRATLQSPTVWEMTFGVLPYYITNTGAIASPGDKIYIFGGTNTSSSSVGPYFAFGKKSEVVGTWTAIPDTNIELNLIRKTQFEWCKLYPLLCYQCSNPDFVSYTTGSQFYEATHPKVCSSAGVCVGNDECQCTPNRFGNRCQYTGIMALRDVRSYADGTFASSCYYYKNPTNSSLVYQGMTGSGWYWIKITTTSSPIQVYCDMVTNNGGWTAYYTTNNQVHLGRGTQNGVEVENTGYIVDLRQLKFSQIMYSSGGSYDWFTCDGCSGYKVGDYIRADGSIHTSAADFGTWTSGGGIGATTYRMYIADYATAIAGTTNSGGLVMSNYGGNYSPTSNQAGFTGYRANTIGYVHTYTNGYGTITGYSYGSGICFRADIGYACGGGAMTVYIR